MVVDIRSSGTENNSTKCNKLHMYKIDLLLLLKLMYKTIDGRFELFLFVPLKCYAQVKKLN